MQTVFGWSGQLCLLIELYKVLATQRLELFVIIALLIGVMWTLLLKLQFSSVRSTFSVKLIAFSSSLLLNGILYAGNYWYAWSPGFSIGIFLLAQLTYVVLWLRHYQQQKEFQI